MTHASKGPCLAFMDVILDRRIVIAERGDPIARLWRDDNSLRVREGKGGFRSA
jgi:hypothetical protein